MIGGKACVWIGAMLCLGCVMAPSLMASDATWKRRAEMCRRWSSLQVLTLTRKEPPSYNERLRAGVSLLRYHGLLVSALSSHADSSTRTRQHLLECEKLVLADQSRE